MFTGTACNSTVSGHLSEKFKVNSYNIRSNFNPNVYYNGLKYK